MQAAVRVQVRHAARGAQAQVRHLRPAQVHARAVQHRVQAAPARAPAASSGQSGTSATRERDRSAHESCLSGRSAEAHNWRWVRTYKHVRCASNPLRWLQSSASHAGSRVRRQAMLAACAHAPAEHRRGAVAAHRAALMAVGRDERERRLHARAQQAQHVWVVRQRRHRGHLAPKLRAAQAPWRAQEIGIEEG